MNLRIGDVISFQRKEQVVIFVNDCRALIVPLTYAVTWKDMPGGHTHFMAEGKGESISPYIEHEDLIRHLTVDQMKSIFSGAAANSIGQPTTAVKVESSDTMKKTNQTAATTAATTSTAPDPVKTGKGRKSAPVTPATPAAEASAPAAEAPKPRPSMKGGLIGRGKFVMENAPKYDASKPADLAEFIKLINTAYPVCNHPATWCVKQLNRARARIADRKARQEAAAEQARVNEENKKKAAAEAAAKAAAPTPAPVAKEPAPAKKTAKKAKDPKAQTALAA